MEVLLLLLPIYFLPSIVAATRNHHNSLAIFVLNLLPGALLVGLALHYELHLQGRSGFAALAFVLSGQAFVYQVVPWVAAICWVLTLVWSLTHVIPETASQPGSPLPALVILGFVVVGALAGLLAGRPSTSVPTTAATIAPTHAATVKLNLPPASPTVPVVLQSNAAETVKRGAELAQWCRAELKKREAKRSVRAKELCPEAN